MSIPSSEAQDTTSSHGNSSIVAAKNDTTYYQPDDSDPKNVPWYNPTPPKVPPAMAELLSTYSYIPVEEQVDHILAIREKAFAIHPYPCLGLYAFLRLHLQTSSLFLGIMDELRNQEDSLFLDLGTGLGQEVRALVRAGTPLDRVRGVELEGSFNDLGFELFRDRDKLENSLLTGDVLLDDGPGSLETLYGTVSILHAASFLHLWDWEGQINVASRMVRLMQDRIGVRMLGRQIGSTKAHAKVHETNKNGKTMWKHDPESFERLWVEVGQTTGTVWDVKAEFGKQYAKLDERTGQWWHDPDTRTIIWSIERIG